MIHMEFLDFSFVGGIKVIPHRVVGVEAPVVFTCLPDVTPKAVP